MSPRGIMAQFLLMAKLEQAKLTQLRDINITTMKKASMYPRSKTLRRTTLTVFYKEVRNFW